MPTYVKDPIVKLPGSSYEAATANQLGDREPSWYRSSSLLVQEVGIPKGQQVEVDPDDLSRRLSHA
jgi:hypothetical protein